MTHNPQTCKPCQINIYQPKKRRETQRIGGKVKPMPANLGGFA